MTLSLQFGLFVTMASLYLTIPFFLLLSNTILVAFMKHLRWRDTR